MAIRKRFLLLLHLIFTVSVVISDIATPYWILVNGDALGYYFVWYRIDSDFLTMRILYSLSTLLGQKTGTIPLLVMGGHYVHRIVHLKRIGASNHVVIEQYQDLSLVTALVVQHAIYRILLKDRGAFLLRGIFMQTIVHLYYLQNYPVLESTATGLLLLIAIHLLSTDTTQTTSTRENVCEKVKTE